MNRQTSVLLQIAPVAGAVAGALAAVPMLVAMDVLDRTLPGSGYEKRLPPLKVTTRLVELSGMAHHVSPKAEDVGGFFAHLGFGGSMGMVYGVFSGLWNRGGGSALPPVATGMAFGLLVWLVSYAGWIPAAGILPPPQRRPPRRNALIILSHLVWGALLGPLTHRLELRGKARPQSGQR